jgi:two-component system LytT family sensor kinase
MIKKIAQVLFNRWTRNILFWVFIAFLHYYPRESIAGYFSLLGIVFIFYGIPVYINNLWLIPVFLIKRKYALYCLLFIMLLCLTTLETYYAHSWVDRSYPQVNFFAPVNNMRLPFYIFPNLLIFGVMAFGKFMSDVLGNERKMETFKQQQLQSELDGLRAQINPHFLFNALNTIYGMARRTDRETADAVLKLSDILRNNLYNGEKSEISMQEEINLIRRYVSFTSLRLRDKDMIRLEIDADVTNQKIVPLILVSFIENAVKHGLDNHSALPAIDIRILLSGNRLTFSCINAKLPQKKQTERNENAIGLKNVKRRLELCYPGTHKLKIDENNALYMVDLKIELS